MLVKQICISFRSQIPIDKYLSKWHTSLNVLDMMIFDKKRVLEKYRNLTISNIYTHTSRMNYHPKYIELEIIYFNTISKNIVSFEWSRFFEAHTKIHVLRFWFIYSYRCHIHPNKNFRFHPFNVCEVALRN